MSEHEKDNKEKSSGTGSGEGSEALDWTSVRERYESTPRELGPELARLARGDRGCLPDVIAGVGALATFVFGMLMTFGMAGSFWLYLGMAMWIGGFVFGTVVQARSAKIRQAAIVSGPLVLGRVIEADEELGRRFGRPARAVLFLSFEENGRWDPEGLTTEGLPAEAATFLSDAESYGLFPLNDEAEKGSKRFLAALRIDPNKVERGKVTVGDTLPLIVSPSHGVVEAIAKST